MGVNEINNVLDLSAVVIIPSFASSFSPASASHAVAATMSLKEKPVSGEDSLSVSTVGTGTSADADIITRSAQLQKHDC